MPGTLPSADLSVTVRYFAGARAAAGLDEQTVVLPPGSSIRTLAATLARLHPPLEKVLGRSSYLCDSVAVRDLDASLSSGATVDVLPPFAGG